MFLNRRTAIPLAMLLAALAGPLLACGSVPAQRSHALATPSGSAGAVGVWLLARSGERPILDFLAGAHHSIDCELYQVTSRPLADGLAQAAARGVRVRVIVEPRAGSTGVLRGERGVAILPTPRVTLDHTKSCLRDDGAALVGTANWSASALTKNADLVALLPAGSGLARQVAQVIRADTGGGGVPRFSDRLAPPQAVVSPVNARALLTAFVAQPGDRLLVTSEELRDAPLLDRLRDAAGRERVDVAAPGEEPTPAGTHRCSSTLYMHAKVMVLWRQGQPAAAFLGSENLSQTSLDRNREIGVALGPAGAREVAGALQPVLTCG